MEAVVGRQEEGFCKAQLGQRSVEEHVDEGGWWELLVLWVGAGQIGACGRLCRNPGRDSKAQPDSLIPSPQLKVFT